MGIRKLASELNLSVSTISRALNDSDEVSEKTRERVREAAARHGYAPNRAAESLRKGRLNTIGLMLPARLEEENYTLALFMRLADGLQSVLAMHGMDLVMYGSKSYEEEFVRLRRIVERHHVDGVILAGTRRHDERIDYVAGRRFPFVAFGRSESGGDHAWIDLDFAAAAKTAVSHLTGLGHQRIAIGVPGKDAMQAHLYLQAWQTEMARAGLPLLPDFVQVDELSERGGYRITETLLALPQPPTAIMFQSDSMAIGAYRKLNELGKTPGRDLAVFGGVLAGDVPEYLSPRLSGFTVDAQALGVRMAKVLLSQWPQFAEIYASEARQSVWPLDLRARDSDGGAGH
ncbi:substrate-binding domain-containing protein [Silvimonas soli]|uniref:substrate-binding domain-containing protein n=1 Tax=Silvimonas soli TaxID=2980100 RepID=UPI0024B32580|nr:substrate-binding domain-containing protein [Silvimonas soli]